MNLLTEIVRIERPARREVLQLRLDRRLLERKFRQTRPGGNNYGKCLSDRGLEWEITTLESALAHGVTAGANPSPTA